MRIGRLAYCAAALITLAGLTACDQARDPAGPSASSGRPLLTVPTGAASHDVAASSYYIYCPESGCVGLGGAYISHYTGANCTGAESYYTPYFGYDGVRRSWDGGGIVGTDVHWGTNKSWRDQYGSCNNSWPDGNTLFGFVTVYRTGPLQPSPYPLF